MVAIPDGATAKLPSLTDRSTNVNLAWKKIILDICVGHLNDASNAKRQTSKQPASKTSRASQFPTPDSIHLLDTDQLWQSLEFQNKVNLPRTRKRLAFLLRKNVRGQARSRPSQRSARKDEQGKAAVDKTLSLSRDLELSGHKESDSEVSDDEEKETSDKEQNTIPRDAEGSLSRALIDDESNADPEISRDKKKDDAKGRLIQRLEDSIVAPKPWALRGEVPASARPKNSLLDATFEFDTSRKADVTSIGDLNASIEDLIKQRVADSQFDDIIPQDAPRSSRAENLKSETGEDDWLSEKPRKGLGEVYADEFRESGKSKSEPLPQTDQPARHQDKKYAEIYAEFDRVMQKLDALCGYSVTPLVSEKTGSAAEAVPEDIVKAETMVSLQDDPGEKKRALKDGGSTRKPRKRKRRKGNGSNIQV